MLTTEQIKRAEYVHILLHMHPDKREVCGSAGV